MSEQTKNKWVPKGDVATVVAAFAVVSGVVLTAAPLPFSELIIGAGIVRELIFYLIDF